MTEKNFEALSQDQYTFAVLDRILRENCDPVWTDHRRLILCHSGRRFPVWIWTPDGLRKEEKKQAWKLSEECRPLNEGYRYNSNRPRCVRTVPGGLNGFLSGG